jgi:hypothetical protein
MTSPINGAVEAAVRSVMADRAVGTDAPAVAAALAGLYDVLARHLEPLMGTLAVRAIYGRSLHLTTEEVPWIAAAGAVVQAGAGQADALRACLEQQDPSAATEGARVLLVAFVDLLARLIGEGLTTRLMAQAWPRAFPEGAGQKAMR